MASGSYKGASINVNDWLILGALAVGGYFIYKSVVKPTAEIGGTISDTTGRAGEAIGSGFDIFNTIFDKINAALQTKTQDTAQPVNYSLVTAPVSALDYVTEVKQTGTAYNLPVVSVKTSGGKSSSIIAKPSTYYSKLGIGFDQYGQGYSAAAPVSYPNKLPVTTTPTKTTTTTTKTAIPATSIFYKKPYT